MSKCEWCDFDEKEWLLLETDSWSVYLADIQDYVGRCILVTKRHCVSFSDMNIQEWIQLKRIVDKLEKLYKDRLGADLCNWSCLMNSFYKESDPNPHLHIHVRPRYKEALMINNNPYIDTEFAHHYALKKDTRLTAEDRKTLFIMMRNYLEKQGEAKYDRRTYTY